MGKKKPASKPRAAGTAKKQAGVSRPPRPAARRTKPAAAGRKAEKAAVRKPKSSAVRRPSARPKPAPARGKKAAAQKPARAVRVQLPTEKRSRDVEKLLAMKADKGEKPAPRREGFLIKAPKKAKQENLVTQARFARKLPTPPPIGTPEKATAKPGKVLLHKKDLDELRQALDAERQRLIAQMAALDETASLTGPSEVNENIPGYSIHLAEYASDNQVVETTLAQRALQAERLAELEEALQRINRPGFGICQNCGKAISLERLKIKPFAQLCVPCRQLKEQGKI